MYLTLGTLFGNTEVFRTVLTGLADEGVGEVVTVGADSDPAALQPVPPNTTVERYIPQSELLPRCSAIVHHGGSGTMYGSLAHGVPQIVLPQGADNFVNGGLLARLGCPRDDRACGRDTRGGARRRPRGAGATVLPRTRRSLAAEPPRFPSRPRLPRTLRHRFHGP